MVVETCLQVCCGFCTAGSHVFLDSNLCACVALTFGCGVTPINALPDWLNKPDSLLHQQHFSVTSSDSLLHQQHFCNAELPSVHALHCVLSLNLAGAFQCRHLWLDSHSYLVSCRLHHSCRFKPAQLLGLAPAATCRTGCDSLLTILGHSLLCCNCALVTDSSAHLQ